MKKPFPAPSQNIKWTNLERNAFLLLWLILFFSLFMAATSKGQLLNISTRGYVGKDDQVLIAGFILKSDTKVVIRALGPSLPVNGKLSDPVLELHDSKGLLKATNDDYVSSAANPIPPANKKESVIIGNLKVGRWSAIVRGKNETGVALVEVYDITPPVPVPSPTPKIMRDVTVSWLYDGTDKRFRVYYSAFNDFSTVTRNGIIPNLLIGRRYEFVVDTLAADGSEGGLSNKWNCLITPTGCIQ